MHVPNGHTDLKLLREVPPQLRGGALQRRDGALLLRGAAFHLRGDAPLLHGLASQLGRTGARARDDWRASLLFSLGIVSGPLLTF